MAENDIAQLERLFPGGGEMGARIRGLDWAASPLGPVARWPQSLLTSVSTCLDCAFPILIWWGPDLVMIYNDEYRPILGSEKHPRALGAAGRAIWPEIWDVIGPMLEQVLERGVATRSRDLLLLMDRFGFEEETYFSFSYSPIRDESGGVGGVFTPVIETTSKVVGERRLRTLRELAAGPPAPVGLESAVRAMAEVLGKNDRDVPFALIYGRDSKTGAFLLMASSGGGLDPGLAPPELFLGAPGLGVAAARALAGRSAFAVAAADLWPGTALPGGAWPEAPSTVLILPVTLPGGEAVAGLVVTAASPRRPLDEEHLGFFELLRGQVGKVFADALAFEEERRRAAALAELDQAKTAFFSNVSHEFRTPLTLMLGALEELLRLPSREAPEEHEPLALAYRSALRLLRLVNDLLDFSRLEAGRMAAAFAPTDFSVLTAELASAFRSVVEQSGLTFTVEAEALGEPVFLDAGLWEKVVLNLLSNAFKFTPGGSITVRTMRAPDGSGAVLSVRDTGVGIPALEVPRLFERFHRVDGSRGRSFEGSGIGLALVDEIVTLHGGAIEVESTPGAGSEFRVRLPFGSAHLPEDRVVKSAVAAASAVAGAGLAGLLAEAVGWGPASSGPPSPRPQDPPPTAPAAKERASVARVLVVEDNRDMRGYLERLIRSEGYEAETAADGRAGLEAARRRPPDLILSDIMMPELDGLGLVQEVRRDPALREVPVILISARAGEHDRVVGVEAGADDYVAKPFAARELMARVRAQLALRSTRREAAEAVVRSEQLLRLAQSAGRIAAWEFEIPTGVLRTSPGTAALWGVEEGAPMQAFLAAVAPEDRPAAEAALERAVAGSEALDIEVRVRAPAGAGVRWFAVRAERLETGLTPRLVGVSFDVTARREAEARLREMNELLEQRVSERTAERDRIWRLSTDLMLVAEFDGSIRAVNPAWTSLLGWPEADLLGRNFVDFVHPEDREETRQAAERLSRGQTVTRFDNRYAKADGETCWISWAATPEGRHLHAVGRDVTPERRQTEALREAQEQLQQAQKMEAIGQLTGGVAHDFNNLLTVIRGSADLLRRPDLPPERRSAYVEAIVQTSERAATLTRQLLAFSRRQLLNPEPFDVVSRIQGIADMLQTVLGSRMSLALEERGGRFVIADPSQFETALVNLLVNARDAMNGTGVITVEVEGPAGTSASDRAEEPAFVAIRIRDEGGGISPEHLARVFDPFFTTKPVGKGTGLGLSQVFGFATQSGGEIAVDSRPGRGSTFTLRLPAADPSRPPVPERPGLPDSGGLTGARILVVDDNPEIGAFAVQLLAELGAEPVLASSGEAALGELEGAGGGFDLVFTDIVMPGLTGLQLRETVLRRWPTLPVVLTTGYSHTLAEEGLAEATVVQKPYAVRDLADALGRARQRSASRPEPASAPSPRSSGAPATQPGR